MQTVAVYPPPSARIRKWVVLVRVLRPRSAISSLSRENDQSSPPPTVRTTKARLIDTGSYHAGSVSENAVYLAIIGKRPIETFYSRDYFRM